MTGASAWSLEDLERVGSLFGETLAQVVSLDSAPGSVPGSLKVGSTSVGCRLWLAAFVDHPEQFIPRAFRPESFAIHQFTETGTCKGVQGHVDLNRLPGGHTALDHLRI